ncbi:MAG: glucosaminidase domain-containing protein [Bacteroidetes bacterium]|nr:glucosaminidase domain-containing protein [Bacteroidota bacterium]
MQSDQTYPRWNNWLFWACVLIAAGFSFVIGLSEGYDSAKRLEPNAFADRQSRTEKVLDDIIASWIPGRVVSNEAGVTAEPFTTRFGFFPDTVVHLAIMVQDSFRVPAPVTLAQWALESGFGKNSLGDHNYFGHTFAAVKEFMAHPAYVVAYDRRRGDNGTWRRVAVRFAKYRSIEECFVVHGEYLSSSVYYRKARTAKSIGQYVRKLSKYYAEDPGYAVKLMAIIERYNLEEKCK